MNRMISGEHATDCPVNNGPAYTPGICNCGADPDAPFVRPAPEIIALNECTIWRVECVVVDSLTEVATFSGPDAEQRARDHAVARYGVPAQPEF